MKKKIIIFTSSGGAGHISASNALKSYLQNNYHVESVFIFQRVFKQVDPMSVISFGKISGEQVYNYFLKKRLFAILNFIYTFGVWYFGLQTKRMIRLAKKYLKDEKPDMVISVTPIINQVILKACQDYNIPFILIPTDLDVTSFLNRIKNPDYKQFYLTTGFDDPLIYNTINPAGIDPNQIKITGLPMRTDFFENKNKENIKKFYNIAPGKPVVVLMMGGQGSSNILNFSKELAQLTLPIHILICTGKDISVHKQLQELRFNENVTVSIIGFTQQISDILAIADLLITKSGSVSFCEGVYMKVPMILDSTATLLYWERLNHIILQERNFGLRLTRINDLNNLVTKILADKSFYNSIKINLENYSKKTPPKEIPALVKNLLEN